MYFLNIIDYQISQNQPFNEQKVRASKHWTYPEEKILINLLLEKKNENPECFKVAYSVWSNITEAINKEFGSNRSVESIKKHYRKMRTKYFVYIIIYIRLKKLIHIVIGYILQKWLKL